MILDILTLAGAKSIVSTDALKTGAFYTAGVTFNENQFIAAASEKEARARVGTGWRQTNYFGWQAESQVTGTKGWKSWGQPVTGVKDFKPSGVLPSMLGPALSAYFLYSGYQENGLKGAFDAGVYDITMSTAIASMQFETQAAKALFTGEGGKTILKHGTRYVSKFGMGTALGIGMAGHMGWEHGKEHFGLAGGIAGMAGGTKLAHMAMTGKGRGKAALIGAGLAGLNWGMGQISTMITEQKQKFDMGRAITKSKVGIDTAGSTAAFFTRNANTMRARAVMSMRNSHLNARSALGMEASYMHMDRNYFSRYR